MTNARAVAAVLTLVEALVVLAFAGFYVYELIAGASDDVTRAVTSGALILVFGAALLVLARGWIGTAAWPRTPTMLWNVLLLPVAWSLHDAGRSLIALAVAVVAIASITAAVAAGTSTGTTTDTTTGARNGDGRDPVS